MYTSQAIMPCLHCQLPHSPSIPIGVVARDRSKYISRCVMTVGAFCPFQARHAADDGVEEARDGAVDGSGGSSDVIWADVVAF